MTALRCHAIEVSSLSRPDPQHCKSRTEHLGHCTQQLTHSWDTWAHTPIAFAPYSNDCVLGFVQDNTPANSLNTTLPQYHMPDDHNLACAHSNYFRLRSSSLADPASIA